MASISYRHNAVREKQETKVQSNCAAHLDCFLTTKPICLSAVSSVARRDHNKAAAFIINFIAFHSTLTARVPHLSAMSSKPNISAKAKAKAEAVEAVEEKKKTEHRLTEAYLYREHPGHIVKERPVWVHEVREIVGERMDDYELEKEYLVIGDDMTEYEWVPSSKFFAPEKVVEFKRQMMEKDKQKTARPTPLSYSDYMERSDRLIPLNNVRPVTIKCAFSQTIEGKKKTFFVVIDEQNKNVVMSQEAVKQNFTKLYHKYLSTIYGFEVA